MRIIVRICLCLAIASLLFGRQQGYGQGNRNTMKEALANRWILDYRQALETAREVEKPLMVVFRCVP